MLRVCSICGEETSRVELGLLATPGNTHPELRCSKGHIVWAPSRWGQPPADPATTAVLDTAANCFFAPPHRRNSHAR